MKTVELSFFIRSFRLDIKQYPTRNSGPTRRFLREALVPPSLKCMAALKFANITVCATYMVLLAGDIQENPGPVTDACAVCTKGCRKNQMAIQCDSCDKWFHAKCISMKRTEYDKLCEPSLAWECITCLSPGFDTLVRKSHETTNTGVKEGKPSVRINKDLHANLKKRGMKFAHVNIATLPGHYADAEVLMEKVSRQKYPEQSRRDSVCDDRIASGLYIACYKEMCGEKLFWRSK